MHQQPVVSRSVGPQGTVQTVLDDFVVWSEGKTGPYRHSNQTFPPPNRPFSALKQGFPGTQSLFVRKFVRTYHGGTFLYVCYIPRRNSRRRGAQERDHLDRQWIYEFLAYSP